MATLLLFQVQAEAEERADDYNRAVEHDEL